MERYKLHALQLPSHRLNSLQLAGFDISLVQSADHIVLEASNLWWYEAELAMALFGETHGTSTLAASHQHISRASAQKRRWLAENIMHEFAASQAKQLTLGGALFNIITSPGAPRAWQPWRGWWWNNVCEAPHTFGHIEQLGGDMVAVQDGTVQVKVPSLAAVFRAAICITREPASGWEAQAAEGQAPEAEEGRWGRRR